jgi:hypothetical protein
MVYVFHIHHRVFISISNRRSICIQRIVRIFELVEADWIRILTALGFVGVFWLSRSTEPGYVLMFIYFLAWLVGGIILYSSLLLPLLGIVSIIAWKFKKPTIRIRATWVLLAIACIFTIVGIFQRSFIKTTYYPLTTNHTELAGIAYCSVS